MRGGQQTLWRLTATTQVVCGDGAQQRSGSIRVELLVAIEFSGEGARAQGVQQGAELCRDFGFKRIQEHRLFWLGGLDSNQDTQIQSLMSYRLDDLPAAGGNKTGPPSSPEPLV